MDLFESLLIMKHKLLALLLFSVLTISCQKDEVLDTCQLVKLILETPLNGITHIDNITLKDSRIEKMNSFDLRNNKDTSNRITVYFEYNQKGKVKAVRDESNPKSIKRFEAEFDSKGNATKISQKTGNVVEDEIVVEYDSQNRPININSRNLLGINRGITYDQNGNPFSILRADFGNLPSITENSFDDKRNLFSSIPEIQYYWIIRPLSTFIPMGDNNILSTKTYTIDGREFKEVVAQRTKRQLTYNEKGYPTNIKVMFEDLSSTITSNSSFEYHCK